MAVKSSDKEAFFKKFEQTKQDIKAGKFEPIYVLCGEEPYYSDVIIKLLSENVLTEQEKDFNYSLIYGNETDAAQVVSLCRRYPVWANRQLVIVKEAQHLTNLSPFEFYLNSIATDTVLVLSFTGKSLDKRTAPYKKFKEKALILESYLLDEWKAPAWIKNYLAELGYTIDDSAAELLSQSTGVALRKIALEVDKLTKGVEGKHITEKDVEVNIGISRDFNAFELCKAIVYKDRAKTFSIAKVFANNPKKYPLVLTLGAMFFYFNQLLKIESLMMSNKMPFATAAMQAGVFGGRQREFEVAARNFPLVKTMSVITFMRDCDSQSKSNERGTADDGELLNELLTKVLL